MVVRPVLILASALTLLALPGASAGAAEQTFHLAGGGKLLLAPGEAASDPLGKGTAVCTDAGCQDLGLRESASYHYTLTQAAAVVPVAAHLFVDVKDATVLLPIGEGDTGATCQVTVYFIVFSGDDSLGGWYYCTGLGLGGVFQAGMHELELEYSDSLKPIEASAGDEVVVSVFAHLGTQNVRDTLYVVSDAEHASTFTLAGTSETLPADDAAKGATAQGNATTTSGSPTPSSKGTSSTSRAPAPATPAPAPADGRARDEGAVSTPREDANASPALSLLHGGLLVAGLGWAARRRLA